MSAPLAQLLGVAAAPAFATFCGAAVALYRTPGEEARSVFQHFAAGVVLAVVAGELLPEITKEHRPFGVLIGFVTGVGLMLAVKAWSERLEARSASKGTSSGLLVAVAIDVLLDGLLIGLGLAAGARIGFLLVIALTLELLFLGISVAVSLSDAGFARGRSFAVIGGLCALIVVGALLGGLLLSGLSGMAFEIVLSFGAAALMYLVVEELLVEAHEVKETPLITASFFAGFVALYLLEWVA